MKLKTLCGLFGAALGLAFYAPASAQTVLDKVYTEQQAQRGADEYQAHCAMCHEGDEPDAPSPKGPVFIERWREAPLDFLYTHISKNMPGNAPGSLKEDQYLDVLAYLLRREQISCGRHGTDRVQTRFDFTCRTGRPSAAACGCARPCRRMPGFRISGATGL